MMRVARWLGGCLLLAAVGAKALPPALQDRLDHLSASTQQELRARDARWAALPPAQQQALRARMAAWDALPEAERQHLRAHWQAWRDMSAAERVQIEAAAGAFAALPAPAQQQLRARFALLDATAQHGWLLGPALGSDYVALQPLLLQVPESQRDRLLAVLHAMTSSQRGDLARLAQRTPPQQRDALRRALLSTSAVNRADWLQSELQR